MRTFAVAAALLATTVTAFPIPSRHRPCGSKEASKTVLLDLPPPASHTLEDQQYIESPRLGKPLQVAVTIEVPRDGALSEAENEKLPGMLSPLVYLLSTDVY